MTEKELRRAEVAYRAAFGRYEEARRKRNQLVREAVAASWSHARIAEAMDLTRSRVGQIALGKD